ncbi:XRN 5'-3' exonuclease N-terminus-domain-containing protein [Tribonema minus]|uniref:XRN 5'-3' exonuclease N-terminus-domain-containing protein n=1 Tax=Tribonema minus TaxID=303371 RepID=A0A835YKU1_9STRA|nr:XRN 5'-3' exonuclease N-terminus-domain-containing protein [Tribonema minus]
MAPEKQEQQSNTMRSLRSVMAINAGKVALSMSGGNLLVVAVPTIEDAAPVVQHVAGDQDDVLSVALSDNGSMLALGAESKAVKLVSLAGCDAGTVIGKREVPKKATALLFADAAGKQVLLASDKFGDVWASPVPDIGSAVKHLLGHTATCVTCMTMCRHSSTPCAIRARDHLYLHRKPTPHAHAAAISPYYQNQAVDKVYSQKMLPLARHGGQQYLVTGDRAEHVRVTRFPLTPLIQSFLVGHTDYITAVAAAPPSSSGSSGSSGGHDPGESDRIVTAAADGTVALWRLLSGERCCVADVEELLSRGTAAQAGVLGVGEGEEGGEGETGGAAAEGEAEGGAEGNGLGDAQGGSESGDVGSAKGGEQGEGDDAAEADEDKGPSRAVYPTYLAVCPLTGLIAVGVRGARGAVAVLRIATNNEDGSAKTALTLAYRLDLPGEGDALALGCAGGALFVAVAGERCLLAYKLGETSAQELTEDSAAGRAATAVRTRAAELGITVAVAADSGEVDAATGLRKQYVSAARRLARDQSRSGLSHARKRFRGAFAFGDDEAAPAAAAAAAADAACSNAVAAEGDGSSSGGGSGVGAAEALRGDAAAAAADSGSDCHCCPYATPVSIFQTRKQMLLVHGMRRPRWLSEKYPKIVTDMMEKRPTVVNGVRMPLDLTEPNPNGMEFDNLYVDMNGIIHPCAHPEDGPQPKTEEEMYVNVMKYVDRLMSAVRPRRVLYLAVDGVAPRAKMNQQRSRRFRAAQEAQEHREVMEETRKEMISPMFGQVEVRVAAQEAQEHRKVMEETCKEMIELGLPVPPVSGPAWDSNVITPGTAFMQRLSVYLRFYIQHRINTNKAWRNIKVILSDANQPGEGEHKIMEYVRQQRTQPGYDPNQHHILHGLDADLIMLGLATHEARFTILREQRRSRHQRVLRSMTIAFCRCAAVSARAVTNAYSLPSTAAQVFFGRKDQERKEAAAAARRAMEDAVAGVNGGAEADDDVVTGEELGHKPLQMLRIWVLREYLQSKLGNADADDLGVTGEELGHKPLQMLRTWVLRECLQAEFALLQVTSSSTVTDFTSFNVLVLQAEFASLQGTLPFKYDFERVVDDFVFLCFFVGNDFLPHLPSLDIRDGALDFLQNVYRRKLPAIGDYLTLPGGEVNLRGVAVIMAEVGEIEDEVFRRRRSAEEKDAIRRGQGNSMRRAGGAGRVGAAAVRDQAMTPGAMKKVGGRYQGAPSSAPPKLAAQKVTPAKRKSPSPPTSAAPAATPAPSSAKGARDASSNKAAADRLRSKLARTSLSTDVSAAKAPDLQNGAGSAELSAAAAAAMAGNGGGAPSGPPPADETPGGENGDGEAAVEDGDVPVEEDPLDEDAIVNHLPHVEEFLPSLSEEDAARAKLALKDRPLKCTLEVLSEEDAARAKLALKDRVKEKSEEQLEKYRAGVQDNVRLWEAGWKDRYYSDKCKLDDITAGGGRQRIQHAYVEGLCWVMRYYYQGVSDWTWYYPFHYAPFASDLIDCDAFELKFQDGAPFRPIEQLMAVLPPASAAALPPPCRKLMLEKTSPIIDFYPEEVPCDPNGKPMPWLWVVLLPFIDEKRLLQHLRPLYSEFTEEETARNSFGPSYIFVHSTSHLSQRIMGVYQAGNGKKSKGDFLRASEFEGWSGTVKPAKGADARQQLGKPLPAPERPEGALEGVKNNQVLCAEYEMPPRMPHVCAMLPGVDPPAIELGPEDLTPRRPPRLNRGMSIAELGTGVRPTPTRLGGFANGHGRGGGGGGRGGGGGMGSLSGFLAQPQAFPGGSPFGATAYMQGGGSYFQPPYPQGYAFTPPGAYPPQYGAGGMLPPPPHTYPGASPPPPMFGEVPPSPQAPWPRAPPPSPAVALPPPPQQQRYMAQHQQQQQQGYGGGNVPTMESLRSRLANTLQQRAPPPQWPAPPQQQQQQQQRGFSFSHPRHQQQR